MPVVPIRADNAYTGLAMQVVQGTAVAPTIFPRWMEGSSIEYDAKFEDVWEGDGSRRLSTIIKNHQRVKVKLILTPRQNEQGFLEKAAMGSGADTITAAVSPSTTLTAPMTAAVSTTAVLASATGLTGTGTIQLLVGAGTANAELITFNLPIATLTLTIAASYNGGVAKNSHLSGETVTNPSTVNTSFTSTYAAGVSTMNVGNTLGLSGFPLTLCCSQGTANEEFVTFSGVTGAGPYTLTVAATYNGGVTLNAHTTADIVISPVTHAITDQIVGNYYTVEVGLGSLSSQGGLTLRVKDCQVETIKRSGKAGGLLMYEVEFVGLAIVTQGSPATVTQENHLPLIFYQATWTLDGATTGDALTVEQFDITQKNNLDVVQTEQVIGAAMIFGQIKVDVSIDIVYQSATLYVQKVYMGSTAGTTDSATVGSGSLIILFACADNFSTLQYKVLTLLYTKAGIPVPKVDGKHFKIPLQASSVSNQGNNAYVLQTTVKNTTATPY